VALADPAPAPNDQEVVAFLKAAVRHRLASVRELDGWFVEETYWNKAHETSAQPVAADVRHSFVYANRSGWLADSTTWLQSRPQPERLRTSFDGAVYREYTPTPPARLRLWNRSWPPPIAGFLDVHPDGLGCTASAYFLDSQIDSVRRERVGSYDAYRLAGRLAWLPGASYVWWLAPAVGYSVVQVLLAESDPTSVVPKARMMVVSDDLRELAPGIWVPFVVRRTRSAVRTGGAWDWGYVDRLTVLEAHVNRDDATVAFQAIAPPGTAVLTTDDADLDAVGGDISAFLERLATGPDKALLAFAKEHAKP
jgi:hypothetical protein